MIAQGTRLAASLVGLGLLCGTALCGCSSPEPAAGPTFHRLPGWAEPRGVQEADVASPERLAIEEVLDEFHAAAARADGRRYFELLAPGGIFYGTDAGERWTRAEFEAYAEPFFSQGRGWTYHSTERHVYVTENAEAAWFDERLHNAKYGETRGTGVLVKSAGVWRIVQYNLTIPLPNALASTVVEMIRAETE